MARPLRIEGAGFWRHVVCRGNGGQRVFEHDKDREAFLARLGAVAASFHVEIYAYALMGNHVHLFTRTREGCAARSSLGEIGKAMGGVGKRAMNMACRRAATRSRRDKHLKGMIARLTGIVYIARLTPFGMTPFGTSPTVIRVKQKNKP